MLRGSPVPEVVKSVRGRAATVLFVSDCLPLRGGKINSKQLFVPQVAGWLSRSNSGRKPMSGRCGIGYSFLRRNHLYVELQQAVPDQRLLYTGVANGKCLCVSLLIR